MLKKKKKGEGKVGEVQSGSRAVPAGSPHHLPLLSAGERVGRCPQLCHEMHSPTYTDNVHEAVHSIADLEEQVLALPFG